MGFGLEQLTDIYIEMMSPLVYSKTARRNLPVVHIYRDVMAGLNALAEKNEEGKEFKREILGDQTIEEAPAEYFDMALAIELNMVQIWDTLDIHTKAKIRAQRYISGMVDVIERYRREMQRKIKALADKGKK